MTESRELLSGTGLSLAEDAKEVNPLISWELDGSNDIANMWPQAASSKYGFRETDQVENALDNQVRIGKVSLGQAQLGIAADWLAI